MARGKLSRKSFNCFLFYLRKDADKLKNRREKLESIQQDALFLMTLLFKVKRNGKFSFLKARIREEKRLIDKYLGKISVNRCTSH